MTLDSTFLSKTASSRSDSSSGKGKATKKLIHPLNEDLLKGRRNTRIRVLPANDPENQLHTPLQIFYDNDDRELNNNAFIVCEYEGIWHQVLFPKETATLAQPKAFIHQYDIPDEPTEELAVLLDQKARISPISQSASLQTPQTSPTLHSTPLQTPVTPTTPIQPTTMTTTTTTTKPTTTATATTPEDIKKVFGKVLR